MKRIAVTGLEIILVASAILVTNEIYNYVNLIPSGLMEYQPGYLSGEEKFEVFRIYLFVGAFCFIFPKIWTRSNDIVSVKFVSREIFLAALSSSLSSLWVFLFTNIFFDPNHALVGIVTVFLLFFIVFLIVGTFLGGLDEAKSALSGAVRIVAGLFGYLFSVPGILIVIAMLLPVATAVQFKRDKDFANGINAVRALMTQPSLDWRFEPYRASLTVTQPIFVRFDAIAPERMLVLERAGKLLAFDKGKPEPELLLDFTDRVGEVAVEKGALGFALHPDFWKQGAERKPYVYAYYTHSEEGQQRNRLSRFDLSPPTVAERSAGEFIMVDLQRNNSGFHNAGMVAFGPDGFLYFAIGDANDVTNWQTIGKSLFSGIFRIDVDSRGGDISHPITRQPDAGVTRGYMIPNDNPFVGVDNALEEFWAVGLRNPFRFSFDPQTGEMWAGDVGAERVEEVDVVVSGGNYQYPYFEGFRKGEQEKPDPLVGKDSPPVFAYRHTAFERAIIGGSVYRGTKHEELSGKYVFADNGSGTLYYLDRDSNGEVMRRSLAKIDKFGYVGISSVQESPDGDILITVLGSKDKPNGEILRLEKGSEPFIDQLKALWAKQKTEDAGNTGRQISLSDIRPVYVENCARCHGVDGKIATEMEADVVKIMPNFASPAWQSSRTDKYIEEVGAN